MRGCCPRSRALDRRYRIDDAEDMEKALASLKVGEPVPLAGGGRV